MADSDVFDFCIIGAGLAGISLAESLQQSGASVSLIDSQGIAAGASGTPLGLVNPATGRYGTKSWNAEACYSSIAASLEKAQEQCPRPFFRKSGVLRPAQDERTADKMRENATTQHWPENWCRWLDASEIRSINPDIHCVDGGMWLPVGLTVDIAAYLKNAASLLSRQGVFIKTGTDYELCEKNAGFDFAFRDGKYLKAKTIIHTSGFYTRNSDYWAFLPLIPVKGQIAVFHTSSPITFDYAISARGYMASLSEHTFAIGSTYEHTFEHTGPDEAGLRFLTSRLRKVYPRLLASASLKAQWAGLRASTPNRMPFVGRHPHKENVFVFAGLGSKGLLYSSWLAEQLGRNILYGNPLPAEVSASR